MVWNEVVECVCDPKLVTFDKVMTKHAVCSLKSLRAVQTNAVAWKRGAAPEFAAIREASLLRPEADTILRSTR